MTVIFNRHGERDKRKRLRQSMPDPEVVLWLHLRDKQLRGLRFRRQYGVGRYVVDFYCPSAKLVIELDGDSHFTAEAERYDEQRDAYLRALGLRMIRFTNSDVREHLSEVPTQLHGLLGGARERLLARCAAFDPSPRHSPGTSPS